MLRVIQSGLRSRASGNASTISMVHRAFSDSHDDFKPKKKVSVPENIEEVVQLIDSQVKNNAVMLYMKGTPSRPQVGIQD